jgi:hypothetical protein
VILIAEGQFLASLQADSHLDVSAPPEDLVCAIQQVLGDKGLSAVAV